MLKTMRKSATSGISKTLIFGMLMAGAVGLAFSGGSGFLRETLGQASTTVATVGRQKIEVNAFDQTVRRQLGQQGLDAHMAYQMGYINQILTSQIDSILLARAAKDLGIDVGDDMVTAQVKKLIAPLVTSGTKPGDALRAILRSQNMSEGQLMDAVRGEMTNTLVLNALNAGTSVMSDTETSDLSLYQHEKRKIETVYMPDSGIKDYKSPTDEVLKPFYESGQERYAVPESRSFTLAILSDKSIKDSVTISDQDLQKAYDEQKDSFALPERRVMDQAILPDEKQAKAVADSLSKGKSLKESVKTVTGDTKAYTGAQTYQREGLDKAIAEPAFKAEKGKVIGPVQTPLGWHVLVIAEIKPPEQQTFEAVKETLRRDLTADRSGDNLYNTSTQVEDQLAGGTTLDDAARTYNMDVVKLGPVHQDGSTPDKKDGMKDFVKDSASVLKTGFGLDEGETSSMIALSDNRYAVVRADKIIPKTYTPFDQVKDELGKLWIADQQNVLNKQRAEESLAKLKEGKLTLADLAKTTGDALKILDTERKTPAEEPMTQPAKSAFFSADKNTYVMQPVKDGFMIGRVTSVTLPDAKTQPADELKTLREALLPALQNEIASAYLNTLREKYKVKVNQATLDKMYAAPQDSDGDGHPDDDQ